MILDELDIKLLNIVQNEFPLVSRPFRRIGEMLVIEESEVINRITQLKKTGIIRRIGPVYNPKTSGYQTTLIALKVDDENEQALVSYINSIETVTHNYKRDGDLNIWFTISYKDENELRTVIDRIKNIFAVKKLINLPAEKMYKLKTEIYAE